METAKAHDYEYLMSLSLDEANKAYRLNEVPVGAIIINEDGKIISKNHNLKEQDNNPCGHAEILSIQSAARQLKSWRLLECTLLVTLEPCPMCLAAMLQARISRLIFGAYDPKGGALGLGYNMHKDKKLNHQISVVGGVLHYECSRILSQFFKEKRSSKDLS